MRFWYFQQVKAYGPGLEKNGVAIGKTAEFTVDAKNAGSPVPLDVSVAMFLLLFHGYY